MNYELPENKKQQLDEAIQFLQELKKEVHLHDYVFLHIESVKNSKVIQIVSGNDNMINILAQIDRTYNLFTETLESLVNRNGN